MAHTIVHITYVSLVLGLSVFAVHRLYLAWAAGRLKQPNAPLPEQWPEVVVQLPLYNEKHVAVRLLNRCAEFDYPLDALEIQILDDSTDNTSCLLEPHVQALIKRGLKVHHIRRSCREGFKAGALKHGMSLSQAPFCAIFDADFFPPTNFLKKLVPLFHDEQVGMVQARWGHLNENETILTQAESLLLDAHFCNEHAGRAARGCFFNFNGTAGIWRTKCIEDAGGWLARTITEDLDLSYRAQLRGWRFIFRPDVVVPAELPQDVDAFKIQQHRWAKGAMEVATFILPRIWREPSLSFWHRLEASFHLLGNLAYPGLIAVAMLAPWVMISQPPAETWSRLVIDSSLLFGATGSLIIFYWVAYRRAGSKDRHPLSLLWALSIGAALALNNTRALIEAWLRRPPEFERTPKLGRQESPTQSDPYLLSLKRGVVQGGMECVLGLYLLVAGSVALYTGRLGAILMLTFLSTGFLFLGVSTLRNATWPSWRLLRTSRLRRGMLPKERRSKKVSFG
jgi:cellulose synthase/poly-beta-1,6-N-acetylglucosamine synthase-like glycosyltransferase